MKHYVYKITEKITNEFYYGVRTCDCNPIDDPYMGSMITWKPNKNNLLKEILCEFNSRDAASEFESTVIKDNITHPLNKNYHTGQSLAFYGKSHYEETKIKVSKTMKNHWKDKTHPTKGTKISDEHKRKISPLGRTHSLETREKMIKTAMAIDRSSYNYKRVKIEYIPTGKIYDSIYRASKELGISRGKIHNDIRNTYKTKVELKFKLL
jgi:hypothetical protein